MSFSAKKSQVEQLLRMKFPVSWAPPPIGSLRGSVDADAQPRHQAMMQAIEKERQALWAFSEPDFQATYSAAIEREQAKAAIQAQIAEKGRFFSRHEAKADFDYWAKADIWTADEAVALLLGKSPDVVTWKHIQPLTKISAFSLSFERLRNLAMRSEAMARGQHAKPPHQVIAWAKSIGHAIPEKLISALEARERRAQSAERRQWS